MSEGNVIHLRVGEDYHVGVYSVDKEKTVHVSYLGKFPWKATQQGGSSPASIARLLLSELVKGQ
jgi:hypothetical protein